jgi:hypothetical protein
LLFKKNVFFCAARFFVAWVAIHVFWKGKLNWINKTDNITKTTFVIDKSSFWLNFFSTTFTILKWIVIMIYWKTNIFVETIVSWKVILSKRPSRQYSINLSLLNYINWLP